MFGLEAEECVESVGLNSRSGLISRYSGAYQGRRWRLRVAREYINSEWFYEYNYYK